MEGNHGRQESHRGDEGVPYSGKKPIEMPGVIFGEAGKPVKKAGVCMTMTECVIELASAMELDRFLVPAINQSEEV